MALILGIDPGSRKTGFGVINAVGQRYEYVASGVIRLPVEESLPVRLQAIHEAITQIIEKYQPEQFAIEQVFLAKSPQSALKLGQARGAAIVAATNAGLEVFEYEAKKIKQSVVGTGNADKDAMQHMVQRLLKLNATPQEDAADALGVALCHVNSYSTMVRLSSAKTFRRGRVV